MAHITPPGRRFSQWYTDVILKTDLVDYAPVRAAAWSSTLRLRHLGIDPAGDGPADQKPAAKNVYFPLLIPESLLLKEAEHVEGSPGWRG